MPTRPVYDPQACAGAMPKGFQVDGRKVCCRFTEVEPTREDNIQLEYMPFAIYRKLQRLRHSVEQNPGNGDARWRNLSNRYRFTWAGFAPLYRLDRRPIPMGQTEAIRRVYLHRPSHAGVKAWCDFVVHDAAYPAAKYSIGIGDERLHGDDPLATLFNYCVDTGVYRVDWE